MAMYRSIPNNDQGGPTSIDDIRLDTLQDLAICLDPPTANGKNWKALADWIGLKYPLIEYLDSYNKRTIPLIQQVYRHTYADACVEEIVLALEELGRLDAQKVLLDKFPGINVGKLLKYGPPRATRNTRMDDIAQQHQEPCLSDCEVPSRSDDMDMLTDHQDSLELHQATTPKSYRRDLIDCRLTPSGNGVLVTHDEPQVVNVGYSPLGHKHQNSCGQNMVHSHQNSDGYSCVNRQHASLPVEHTCSPASPPCHSGSHAFHYNHQVSSGACCQNYPPSPTCRQHLQQPYQNGLSPSMDGHMTSMEHCRSGLTSDGRVFQSLPCSHHVHEGPHAMDWDRSDPMDLSMSNLQSTHGLQIVPTQGQMTAAGPTHHSYRPQFSLTSTGCSDVHIGGAPARLNNSNVRGPLNLSQQCQMNDFKMSRVNDSQQDPLERRPPTKTASWPEYQGSSNENLFSSIGQRHGDSVNSVLQTVPHDTAPRPSIFLTYTNDNNSTMKRVLDCGECLKKNKFKVSVDMFEAKMVNTPQMEADWHNIRYEKADFIVVAISKKYRENIEKEKEGDTITQGATHAKHIFNKMLEGRKRIVLLMFPHTDPNIHIPPQLKKLASAVFDWPNNWNDVLYYLIFPQQIVHVPNSNISSSGSSVGSGTQHANHGRPVGQMMVNGQTANLVKQHPNHTSHVMHRNNDYQRQASTKRSLEEAVAMSHLRHKQIKNEILEEKISPAYMAGARGAGHLPNNHTFIEQKMC